jgi:hypothetical protein
MSRGRPKVAGLAELCAKTGVSKSTAAGWLRRGAPHGLLPLPPYTDLASGPVWNLDDIEVWAESYREACNLPTPGCSDCARLGEHCSTRGVDAHDVLN